MFRWILAGWMCMPVAGIAQGLAFAGAGLSGAVAGESEGDAPDAGLYADGTRAINDARWTDAEKIFTRIVGQHGAHEQGALYWKAYAENKLGHIGPALQTCGELGKKFPASSWVHECGALEIEIDARNGKPVGPRSGDDDDLKLLALNALMKKDESRALAEIQEILNGDSSEKLKKEALFILGNHYSDATYGQVVRVSFVEGDVRVTRGKENEKAGGAEWETATADLPLETGFSLVTGAGRAEIELEDASTIYLGENSVLTFNDLTTTAGVPYTEVALLTGTVTLHVKPYVRGEVFVLKTPTDRLMTAFPSKSYLRVSSYSDGIAVASMNAGAQYPPHSMEASLTEGQTAFYRDGKRLETESPVATQTFASWDKWVAERIASRKAAMMEVMEASGLSEPVPGLAEMKGQGHFFACPPYGTCWEPNGLSDGDGNGTPSVEVGGSARLVQAETDANAQVDASPAAQNKKKRVEMKVEQDVFFPCLPTRLRYYWMGDFTVNRLRVEDDTLDPREYPFEWAVCHAGSWIHRGQHYAWVPTHKRHHLPPGRWVKSGKTVAFVPLHPYDVKGRPAINQKEEVFAVNTRNGISVEKTRLAPGEPVEALKEPPKEFRSAAYPPLAHADEPRMTLYTLKEALESKGPVKATGIQLSLDHKTGTFNQSRQMKVGDKVVTVSKPMNNHGGNLQARGGSYAGGGSYHNSRNSSSGGTHSGGGASGGGGAGHAGGGSTSTASSSSAASSSAASSGGSHH